MPPPRVSLFVIHKRDGAWITSVVNVQKNIFDILAAGFKIFPCPQRQGYAERRGECLIEFFDVVLKALAYMKPACVFIFWAEEAHTSVLQAVFKKYKEQGCRIAEFDLFFPAQ